jgi:hypothetical protein
MKDFFDAFATTLDRKKSFAVKQFGQIAFLE